MHPLVRSRGDATRCSCTPYLGCVSASVWDASGWHMVLGHFALPDEAWWTGFYTPMEQRIRRLRPKYEGEAEAAHPLDPPRRDRNAPAQLW